MKLSAAFIALAVAGSSVLFTNCKKDKKTEDTSTTTTPTPVPETNTQKLCGKNFKITAITVNPGVNNGTTTITDWYASVYYSDCLKDNLTKFNTNGTVIEDEGSVVCSGSAQTSSGNWLWNTNETVLTVTSGTNSFNFNVLVNDGNTLKGTVTETANGTNYVFTYTYMKQ